MEQETKRVRCESCGQAFDSNDELARHEEFEHPDLAETGRERMPASGTGS